MPDPSPAGRAIVAGWFSYEQSDYTAGDLLARDVACQWLRDAGLDVVVAMVGGRDGGVELESVDPAAFTHAVFVCGPFMQHHWEAAFFERFASCTTVGLNLTLPIPIDTWQPFDVLVERDSTRTARPDLAYASRPRHVPVIGVCRVEPYPTAQVDLADAAISRLLASREAAVVPIDTRLDTNVTGLRTAAEVESLIARVDALVTTRLHGLVLGLKHGVPVLAIDPHPGGGKIVHQARVVGWPHVHDVGSLDDAALSAALDACLDDGARAEARACRDRAVATLADVKVAFHETLRAQAAPRRAAAPARAARRLRVLHAIHDFLPRHCAGSEIYAADLCAAIATLGHDVTVVCAEYDPGAVHGHVRWRTHAGLPVVEIVNNWLCRSFADTYVPPLVGERLAHVLDMVEPDVLHVHNLLNLSFQLPAMAHARGIPVVATLHDYTLVCPSGGQRLHRADAHVCRTIEPARCARCFPATPFFSQMAFGVAAPRPGPVQRLGALAARLAPRLTARAAGVVSHATAPAVTAHDITRRLETASDVLRTFDLVVAPSQSLADEYLALGADPARLRVSDYGFPVMRAAARSSAARLRVGYVGSLVWHKGVHVAIEALRHLPARQCDLLVYGDPRVAPDYAADLKRRAAGLPVTFAGAFDRDRTAEVFASFDVLVVPSIWMENSPLVVHEAFMSGVPVVAARMGGLRDLVRDGWNGWLVDPGDPLALAQVLGRLLARPGLVADVASRLPRVKTIEDDARVWVERYHDVLARHRVVDAP